MNFHSDFIGKREQNVVMTELSVLLKLKLKETIIFDFGGCLIYLEKISVQLLNFEIQIKSHILLSECLLIVFYFRMFHPS